MPWRIEQRGDQFCVVKKTDGSTEACHGSQKEAKEHMAALYANEAASLTREEWHEAMDLALDEDDEDG